MTEFETEMAAAGAALTEMVEGPGQAAADALQKAFETAGTGIEQALSRAARSGELDFRQMAEAVLADLARIAAEAVLARSGLAPPAQTLTVNLGMGQARMGPGQGGAVAGELASRLAALVARGGRFL